MAKEALIVGVTGIAGNNIAQVLLADGWKVYGLSRKPGITIPGVNHLYADVLDQSSVEKASAGLPISHLPRLPQDPVLLAILLLHPDSRGS